MISATCQRAIERTGVSIDALDHSFHFPRRMPGFHAQQPGGFALRGFDSDLPITVDILSRRSAVVRACAKRIQADRIARGGGAEATGEMTGCKRRVQRLGIVVEGEQEMVASEDTARGGGGPGTVGWRVGYAHSVAP